MLHVGKRVGGGGGGSDGVREFIDLFSADPGTAFHPIKRKVGSFRGPRYIQRRSIQAGLIHSTALYFLTSSFFTFLNISW